MSGIAANVLRTDTDKNLKKKYSKEKALISKEISAFLWLREVDKGYRTGLQKSIF